MKKIPIPIFEACLNAIKDPAFHFGGVDVRSRFPEGFSKDELLASLNWMYRRTEKERVYKLISTTGTNREDIESLRFLLLNLEPLEWREPPFHFNEVCDDMIQVFERLIGPSKKIMKKHSDVLGMHFLTAFHLTEVDLKPKGKNRKTRCFLSMDSTASGNLSLNLGLYQRENGVWDSIELSQPNWPLQMAGSHYYTSPFLVTDLKEEQHFWPDSNVVESFGNAIKVARRRNGTAVLRPVVN